MLVCESEENRRKLAWLVSGYILLAWFFCVVFQPLGFTNIPGRGNNNDLNDESLYEIINLQDDPQWKVKCESGERQQIILSSGRGSGLILRLTNQDYYRYAGFSCSLEVVAGPGMDGVTAVLEHMDLRGEETGQWHQPNCPDYVDIRAAESTYSQPTCGQWDVERDHKLKLAGVERNIFGYCVEDREQHSCETKNLLVDVAIEHNITLSNLFPALRKSDRHGFTIVFTAWRHADVDGECKETEMVCPNSDGGVHASHNHCVWDKMVCDGHQNCGFLANKDEWSCRLGRETPWSFGTITVLVTIWIAIVTILMLATVFLLQWNRLSFRTPLGLLSDSTRHEVGQAGSQPVTERLQSGHVMSTASAPDPRTGGMVSIMVMYRPPNSDNETVGRVVSINKTSQDLPPTYESLFMGENPPGYNMLTVNIPSTEAAATAALSAMDNSGEASLQQVASTSGGAVGGITSTSVQSNLSQAIDILQRVAQHNTAATGSAAVTPGSCLSLSVPATITATQAETLSPSRHVSVDTIVDISPLETSSTSPCNVTTTCGGSATLDESVDGAALLQHQAHYKEESLTSSSNGHINNQ